MIENIGEIKKFSKEHSPEERKIVAQEIKNKRKEYFDDQIVIADRINFVEQEVKRNQLEVSEAINAIELLENKILQDKDSAVSKILKLLKIDNAETDLAARQEALEILEQEMEILDSALSDLQEDKSNEDKLQEARDMLGSFYQNKSEEWVAYEKEQAEAKVEKVISNYDVAVVHGILPWSTPGSNSLLHSDTDFKTKLEILLALEPTISTSTVQKNDITGKNIFGAMGVLVVGGQVIEAEAHDFATVSLDIKTRTRHTAGKTYHQSKNIASQIDKSIIGRHNEGYNELVVANPKIAGMFVAGDLISDDRKRYLQIPHEEVTKIANEHNLQTYVLLDGEVYEGVYSEKNKRFECGEKIDVKKLTETPFEVTTEKRNELISSILDKTPFRICKPEVDLYNSRSEGRCQYFDMIEQQKVIDFPGEEEDLTDEFWHYFNIKKENSNPVIVKKIFELKKFRSKVEYCVIDKKLFRREYYEGQERSTLSSSESLHKDFEEGYITIGGYHKMFGRPIRNFNDYFSCFQDLVIERNEGKAKQISNPYQYERHQKWNDIPAFHLYGLAEQAAEMGDEQVSMQARDLARQLTDQTFYEEFKKKRIGEAGEFKMRKEDLGITGNEDKKAA